MIYYSVGWIMTIIGILYVVLPSKKRHFKYGYRTSRARLSDATYRYAQKYAAKVFLIIGLITLAIGYILKLSGLTNFFIIELVTIFIPIMIAFYQIEKKLQIFNDQLDDNEKGEDDDETFND